MTQELMTILQSYVQDALRLYGTHLQAVILYGSYARGDFGPDSDIDIMFLVDWANEDLPVHRRQLTDVTYDYNDKYDLMIMPTMANTEHFNKWLRAYPFYNNVNNEGVTLYAA